MALVGITAGLTAILVGSLGVIAWANDWPPFDKTSTAAGPGASAGSTSKSSAKPSSGSSRAASPSARQETAVTASVAPSPSSDVEVRRAALAALDQKVGLSRGYHPIRGQWVAQLASKSEGIVDLTQQPTPFTLQDILAEIERHEASSVYGPSVRVVLQGDWGGSTPAASPLWVTFADLDARSKDEVVSWCESHFAQRGQALLNVCYPRQMKVP